MLSVLSVRSQVVAMRRDLRRTVCIALIFVFVHRCSVSHLITTRRFGVRFRP
jgi:hypothetical protein